MTYQFLSDDELMDLLSTEEDRLPRAAVDEFVRRGERMIPLLSEIVSSEFSWRAEPPGWWAVVHAVFILGAIGGKGSALALAKALRWAVMHDCDWVTEKLAAILSRIDPVDRGILKIIAGDKSSDWYTRSLALDGLAGLTIYHPEIAEEVFSFIGGIFNDYTDDWELRGEAGNVLLDFLRSEYKNDLLFFGKEGKARWGKDRFDMPAFVDTDVRESFESGEKNLWNYTRDWLEFYSEEEIARRQERWQREAGESFEEDQESDDESSDSQGPYIKDSYIGRNDPCPCGSGKKYKKCCLGKL